ncbi:MAG TPA: hypothetical protein VGB68_15155 [Pyrinomonadaceae bacterium]|jgi:hypothetical protein
MFQGELLNVNLLSADVPESLALLVFGVCLIGATVGLRRLLKRYDEEKTDKSLRQK